MPMEQKPICKAYKIICMDKCSYTKLQSLSSELSVLSSVKTDEHYLFKSEPSFHPVHC